MIAESDPSRSSQQKLAVEKGVIDAYNYGLQASPRLSANEKLVVESYIPEEELDGFSAPEKAAPKKRRNTTAKGSASANKGLGRLETFKLKEREREYNRKLAELDQKAEMTKKDSVLRSLLK